MNNIKELCYRRGLTYEELSQKTGISIARISYMAIGKRKPIKEEIERIKDVLNVSEEELLIKDLPDLKFENFVQNIERYGRVKALTRGQIADKLEVSISTLNNMLQMRSKPRVITIRLIIKTTQVETFDEFLANDFLKSQNDSFCNVERNIRKYMHEKNKSLREFAKICNINEWTLYDFIRGKNPLSPKTFSSIIEGTGIPAEKWLSEDF